MTKKNKQQRTPPAKDKLFEQKTKYLNEKQAAKAAIQAENMIKKGVFKEVLPIDAPVFSSNSTEATEMLGVETHTEVSTGDAGLISCIEELPDPDKEEGLGNIDAASTTPVLPPTKAVASQGLGVVGSYAEALLGGANAEIANTIREQETREALAEKMKKQGTVGEAIPPETLPLSFKASVSPIQTPVKALIHAEESQASQGSVGATSWGSDG
ncbi:unnamed protein product [Cuscuta epithymum]|uniref:Uncharacterized protein n=1 Tax=Cuscuta epithymum TaxID=186058 RepID=A0AAV0FZI2_9ASTE|nr:unnamed protein product [Cuscuta epithymum]